MTAGLTWLTANDIRTKGFTKRRGKYPAEEVRAFLDHVAMLMDARSERIDQLADQLSIAESDHRAVVELNRALAAARADIAMLKDRVALAETVREDALTRLKGLLEQPKHQMRREPALGTPGEGGDEQAQHIIDEAARSAVNLHHEQQRWADEARLALRTRIDELEAETDVQVSDAREAAARIVTAAADEAERIVGHALAEADRLMREARAFSSAWFATESERRSDWETLCGLESVLQVEEPLNPEQPPMPTIDVWSGAAVAGSPPPPRGSRCAWNHGSNTSGEVNAGMLLAKAAQLVSAAALMSPAAEQHKFTALLDRGAQQPWRSSPTRARGEGEGDATRGPKEG